MLRFFGGVTAGLAVTVLACTKERTPLPLQPARTAAVTALTLEGPGAIPPGTTARFSVTIRLSDGTTEDATDRAAWSSSDPSVLTVTAGLATAHAIGDARVSASLSGRGSIRDVIVVPPGTYRLTGIVSESDTPAGALADALVEVAAGSGAGLTARTGADGRYRLYGVSGDVQLRVSKNGYQTQEVRVVVTDHLSQDVELRLMAPRSDVTGTYMLTITAASSCRDTLPEDIRIRRYTAELVQDGAHVDARLRGATFAVSGLGRGDRFRGRVDPSGVSFTLRPYLYKYYGYEQYPDIAELLPAGAGYVVLDGSAVVRGSRALLSGTLTGSYQYFRHDPAWGALPVADCDGGHEFVLSRVGGS